MAERPAVSARAKTGGGEPRSAVAQPLAAGARIGSAPTDLATAEAGGDAPASDLAPPRGKDSAPAGQPDGGEAARPAIAETSAETPVGPTPPSLGIQAAADAAPAQTPPETTVANLSAQIAHKTTDGASRFDLQLTPEGLGRVDVAVQIDARGRVTATLAFEKADAAALIRDRADDLRTALASAGLTLSPDAISVSHVTAETAQAASAAANPPPSSGAAQPTTGQGGFAASGQGFGQGQSGQGQSGQGQSGQQGQGAPTFAIARSFQDAAAAADLADLQTAYRATLSTRGLDIRI